MTKLKYAPVVLVIIATLAVIIWQQRRIEQLSADVAALRAQAGQLKGLQDEHDRLTAQLKTAPRLSQAELDELLRLRVQVGTTAKMAQQNVHLKAEVDRAAKPAADAQAENEAMEREWNDRTFGAGSDARVRMQHAMRWVSAALDYAKQHQGQFPASLQDAVPFLNDEGYAKKMSVEDKAKTAQTADQYDLVYNGTLADMTNPPPEATIMIRQRQPMQTANGQWAKFYVSGSGGGTYHFSDDGNFDEFESRRIPR